MPVVLLYNHVGDVIRGFVYLGLLYLKLRTAVKQVVKDSPLERDESSIIVVTGGRPGPSSHCSLSKHQFKIKQ